MFAVGYVLTDMNQEISSKSRLLAILLVFFLGTFGAHRFYLGRIGSATVMLLLGTFGAVGYILSLSIPEQPVISTSAGVVILAGLASFLAVSIWALVDFITIISGRMKDERRESFKKWK